MLVRVIVYVVNVVMCLGYQPGQASGFLVRYSHMVEGGPMLRKPGNETLGHL